MTMARHTPAVRPVRHQRHLCRPSRLANCGNIRFDAPRPLRPAHDRFLFVPFRDHLCRLADIVLDAAPR